MIKSISSTALVAGLSMASFANASGSLLQEATYANLGTAGAGDGVYTESATSIWTNPAISASIDGGKSTVSGTLLNLDMEYRDSGAKAGATSNSTLPVLSFFHVMALGNQDTKLGFALSSGGGATLDYGDDWAGKAQLTDVSLLTYQFNPSISHQISEKWSVGLGAQFDYAVLEGNTSALELDKATDLAIGYNIGTVYHATDKLRLGLSYRSELNHKFDSDLSTANRQGQYKTSLITPAITDLSGAYQLSERVTLLSSVQYHNWSAMESTNIAIDGANYNGTYSIDRDWDDVWRFSVGTEYQLNTTWKMKLGYAFETSPLDDPSKQSPDLPVGEQHRYSIGFGRQVGEGQLDLYYQYADFGEMSAEQNKTLPTLSLSGEFEGQVHFVGASYTF